MFRGIRLAVTVSVLAVALLAVTAAVPASALTQGGGTGLTRAAGAPSAPVASGTTTASASSPPIGGPAPGGASVCANPDAAPFNGQIVIAADGSVTPGAPVSEGPGQYVLTGPVNGSILDLASNAMIDGSGCPVVYATTPVTLYGNSTPVEVRNASNVTVENFPLTGNTTTTGVAVVYSTSVTVYNVSAANEMIGIAASESTDVNFTLDEAQNASEGGIGLFDVVTGIAQDDNASESTIGFGAGDSLAVTFRGDTAIGTGTAITLVADEGTTVIDNDFALATSAEAFLVSSAGDLLADNNLSGDAPYGIQVGSTAGALNISGNDLAGGLGDGIFINSAMAGVTIWKNVIANTTNSAIDADGEVTGPLTVVGNDLSVNSTVNGVVGVNVGTVDSSVTIADNNLQGGLSFGVDLSGNVGGDVRIADNRITNATIDAIVVTGSVFSSVYVTGNDLSANATTVGRASGFNLYLEAVVSGSLYITDNQGTGLQYAVETGAQAYVIGSVVLVGNDFADATIASVEFLSGAAGNFVAQDNDFSANASTAKEDSVRGLVIADYGIYGTTTIVGNDFTGGLFQGINIDPFVAIGADGVPGPSGTVTIAGNNFANVTYQAVYLFYVGGNLHIENNDFSANASTVGDQPVGVYVDYATDTGDYDSSYWYPISGSVVVTGNNFTGGLYYGLDFATDPFDLYDGAGVLGSVTIVGNDFVGTYSNAVALYWVGGNLLVEDNDMAASASTFGRSEGVYVESGIGGSTTIVGNNLSGVFIGLGLNDVYGPVRIVDNDLSNVTGYAITAYETGALTVEGNDLATNPTAASLDPLGIDIEYASTATIIGNNLSGGLAQAIYVENANALVAIGNDLSGTTAGGISSFDVGVVTISGNDASDSQGVGILVASALYLSITNNTLTDSLSAISVSDIDGPAYIDDNNASGSGSALNLSMASASYYYANVEENNLSDSGSVTINGSSLNLIGNDLLGTPNVNLTNDTVYSFYHNNFDTDSGAVVNVTNTAPVTGSFNAPLPTGGNYWSGYSPTSVTNGIGSPPYLVGNGYYDEYPLAEPWTPYSITFAVSGLAPGTDWSVEIAGVGEFTAVAPAAISFFPTAVQSTTFSFTIAGVGGLIATPASGAFTTNGTSQTIDVSFGSTAYALAFGATGLPDGTEFSVTFDDAQEGTATAPNGNIGFTAVDGTYPYTAVAPQYAGSPPTVVSGEVTIDGSNIGVTVVFNSTLTFEAEGLPAGTPWYVNFTSYPEGAIVENVSTTATTVTLTDLPLGYYTVTWATANKSYYLPGGDDQGFTLSSGGLDVEQTFEPYEIPVIFTETGYPDNAAWCVTVSSPVGFGCSPGTGSNDVEFEATNGSYSYTVEEPEGYTPSPVTGSFAVAGVTVSIPIAFTDSPSSSAPAAYPVEFSVRGQLGGTDWTVVATIAGGAGSPIAGEILIASSSGLTAQLTLTNGTYEYTVTADGYPAATGAFSVSGGPTTIDVTFTEHDGPSPSWNWAGELVVAFVALASAAALVVALLVGVAILRRRRGGDPPECATATRPSLASNEGER